MIHTNSVSVGLRCSRTFRTLISFSICSLACKKVISNERVCDHIWEPSTFISKREMISFCTCMIIWGALIHVTYTIGFNWLCTEGRRRVKMSLGRCASSWHFCPTFVLLYITNLTYCITTTEIDYCSLFLSFHTSFTKILKILYSKGK